eukprot:PITA_13821
MAANQSETTAKPKPSNSITIKLMVSKRSGKIMYAEAGKDFVDLLFSFLVLPSGAIAKHALVSKDNKEKDDTRVCCITNLYKSVESLSPSFMKGDKAVLLDPKVFSATYTSDTLNIKSSAPAPASKYYVCPRTGNNSGISNRYGMLKYATAYGGTHGLSTQNGTVNCSSCGNTINCEVKLEDNPLAATKDSVRPTGYVKKTVTFFITDDLSVIPSGSTATIVQLWNKLDVKEPTELEEQNVPVGPNEVTGLLKAAMVHNTALNAVFKAERKSSTTMDMGSTGISLQELVKLLNEAQKNRSSDK